MHLLKLYHIEPELNNYELILMEDAQYYEEKLPEITDIKDNNLIKYIKIPVAIYLQEAENFLPIYQRDKKYLLTTKLDWKIVEDIPIRAGALREAESRWITKRFTKKETGMLWEKRSKEIFEMRNFLLHEFRFAYKDNKYLLGRINAIARSQAYAAMIQDLNDLSVLGKENSKPLKAIGFDMAKLDEAAALAEEAAGIIAAVNAESDYSAEKKIRDQAFSFLKFGVDEICSYGQYVFWKNDARKKGYSISQLRRTRKRKNKEEDKDKEKNEGENKGESAE